MVSDDVFEREEFKEALRILPTVMRPSFSKVIIEALDEQKRIIDYYRRTSRKRELAFEAALAAAPQPPKGEPVGWFHPYNEYHGYQQVAKEHEGKPGTIPLYTSPQITAKRATT